jgi:hypothetical protein
MEQASKPLFSLDWKACETKSSGQASFSILQPNTFGWVMHNFVQGCYVRQLQAGK